MVSLIHWESTNSIVRILTQSRVLIYSFETSPRLTFRSFAVQPSMRSTTGRLVVILAHTCTKFNPRVIFLFLMSLWHTIHKHPVDLLRSLFGTRVRFILVGGRRLRAAGGLVQELPQTLRVVPH